MKPPRQFYATENRDNDGHYIKALLDAGYQRVENPQDAEFILHDSVRPKIRDFLLKHPNIPNFVTPHTPQSWFLFDGIQPKYPTNCNFVAGKAAVRGMKAYGYPYRVEAVGFSRCKVRPFAPTKGNDLLIVPAHPDQKGRYALPRYIDFLVMPILEMVKQNRSRFGKITLAWSEVIRMDPRWKKRTLQAGFTLVHADPFTDPHPLISMMERIDAADLVLACGTTACVSVAMGKPTVFITEVGVPFSPPRFAQNSHLYLHEIRFPLAAETMTIDEILDVRHAPNPRAEKWKRDNIGGDFRPQRFVDVVEECLQ